MECFLQYWDDLDDLYWLVAALRERILSMMYLIGALLIVAGTAWAGIFTAQHAPLAALLLSAFLSLLLVARRGGDVFAQDFKR